MNNTEAWTVYIDFYSFLLKPRQSKGEGLWKLYKINLELIADPSHTQHGHYNLLCDCGLNSRNTLTLCVSVRVNVYLPVCVSFNIAICLLTSVSSHGK